VFQVRNTFLLKLGDVLPLQRLLPRWNVLPVLAALDPDPENVQIVSQLLAMTRSTHQADR
jgi:sister-chromatid-cohesion protein PDS5